MGSCLKIFRIQLFKELNSKVLYMGMLLCSPLKFGIYIQYVLCHSYIIFYKKNIHILCKFYPVRSWNNNLIMFLYKRNMFFLKLLFCYWATFLWTLVQQTLTKLIQYCFLNVEATLINIRWLNFHLQQNINVETTFGHRHWST